MSPETYKEFAKDLNKILDKYKYDITHYNEWYKINNNTKIVAWMPLPKPYEEAEE